MKPSAPHYLTKNSLSLKPFALIVVGALATQVGLSAANRIYVAPGGTGDGSEGAPFGQLEDARDAIRKAGATKHASHEVILADGVYFLDKTFNLNAADSASEGQTITYKAAEGATPTLSGGQVITGWEPAANGLWSTKVDDLEFRQLYVDGDTATRSRYPESDEFFRLETSEKEARRIIVPEAFIKKWDGFNEVEMHVTLLWAEAILRLKDYEPVPDQPGFVYLSFQEPESELVFKRHWPRFVPDQAFHFENALEFADTPGEWFHDAEEGILYYYPKPGQDMTQVKVIAPKLDQILHVEGTADNPVTGIRFEGLTFSHTNWMRPSEMGHLHMQAGQYTVEPTVDNDQFVGRIPAAVRVNWAQDVSFESNVFTQLGSHALDFHTGVQASEIVGNVFYDLAASGIMLGEFSPEEHEIHIPWYPDDPREITSDILVANNYIRRIGTAYPGSCGIAGGYVSDIVIEYNELCDLPYTGISLGWGWTDQPSALRDNTIRYNHIHSLMRDLTDGGGIYTLSLQPGTQVYRNYVHHAMLTPKSHDPKSLHSRGIYFDEASGGTDEEPFIIRENMVHATTQDFRAHIPGKLLLDAPHNYLKLSKHTTQRYAGQVIADGAGLTDAYASIKKALPFKPFTVLPKYNEILSRSQKEVRGQTGQTTQIVMATDLVDDPEVIERYEYLHSAEGVWPEVVNAAEVSGIEKIKIYRVDNRLFMVIDIPKDANPDAVFKAYGESDPRVKDWADTMLELQTNLPGYPEGSTWQGMELIHDYEYGETR